jgi:hypothetical protein
VYEDEHLLVLVHDLEGDGLRLAGVGVHGGRLHGHPLPLSNPVVLGPRLTVHHDRAALDQPLGGGAGRCRPACGEESVEAEAGVLGRGDQLV